ncbi:MAG TPA: hypothetical protein VMF29_02700 [Candidatus Edwardsbacteria bacterium]|nr:hypothetical protein [Candidatus Edwardsbacteria bacterium]
MDAKGVTFLARKKLIAGQFGADKWEPFIAALAKREPYFKTGILPTTLIPIDAFLRFNEAVLKTFYRGDERGYIAMGETTAEYSLLEGPYKTFLWNHDYQSLIEDSIPKLWKKFYSAGRVEASYFRGGAEALIRDLPVTHPYFDYAVVGYMKRALELGGAVDVSFRRVKDDVIHFKFKFTE